jgi:hypothetical protein
MRTFLTVILFAAAASLSFAQSPRPGERIATELLEVTTPASAGWRLAARSPAHVAMARRGSQPDETFAAFALLFRIEPPRDRDHFMELVRKGAAADTPPERFREHRAEFQHDESRGHVCILYRAVHEDLQARLISGGTGALTLQSLTRYCQHPQEQGVAWAVGYSHRGHQLVNDFDVEAAEFVVAGKALSR